MPGEGIEFNTRVTRRALESTFIDDNEQLVSLDVNKIVNQCVG